MRSTSLGGLAAPARLLVTLNMSMPPEILLGFVLGERFALFGFVRAEAGELRTARRRTLRAIYMHHRRSTLDKIIVIFL